MKFEIGTVVYSEELPLLRIQAVSFKKFLDLSDVTRVWVVANDADNKNLCEELENMYFKRLGFSRDMIEIVPREAFIQTPFDTPGYISQQLLKLHLARHVSTEHYTVFDAKNFLIKPLNRSHLFSDTKPKCVVGTYTGFQKAIKNNYCSLLGLSTDKAETPSLAMMTPFTFYTELVPKIYEIYESKLGVGLDTFFINELSRYMQVSEFLLYDVGLKAAGVDIMAIYQPVLIISRTLWENACKTLQELENIFQITKNSDITIFGIHRNRLKQMGVDEVALLDAWLSDLNIDARLSTESVANGHSRL